MKTNDKFDHWAWENQDDWCCSCSNGNTQSPIDLVGDTALERPNNHLKLSYKPVQNVFIVYNGNEIEILGRFGKMRFQNELGERVFDAYKVTVKFPGEHTIDGKHFEGELQIHHKSKDV